MREIKTSTLIVISAFICVIAYTIAAVVLQYVTDQTISEALTYSWFGFWGLEMGVLGTITSTKAKNNKENNKK